MKSLIKFLVFAFLLLVICPSYGWSKTKIAVLPWKVNSAENMDFVKSAVSDMLTSRLGALPGEGVEVISPEVVRSAVKSEVTEASAAETGKKLRADYALFGSLTILGNAISVDARLLNLKDGSASSFSSKSTGIDSVIALMDKLSADVGAVVTGAPKQAAVAAMPMPAPELKETLKSAPLPVKAASAKDDNFIIRPQDGPAPALWKSAPMDGLYIAMAAADLDKDGVKELFLLTKKKLLVSRINSGKLETVKEIKAEPGVEFAAVSIFDGNGGAGLFVSGVRSNRPYTSFIQYSGNDYKTAITGIKWLVKAVQGPKGPMLIGQDIKKGEGFSGKPRVLKKEGNKVIEAGLFDTGLPRGLDIYRFDTIMASGEKELMSLDDRDYLQGFRLNNGKWEKAWKSADFFGGTLNYIELKEETPGSEPVAYPVEGAFIHNPGKAGADEVIIKRNVPGGLGRWGSSPGSFKSGAVMSMTIDSSGGFTENWRTKEVNGYIADFFMADLENNGGREITMLVVEGTESVTGTPKSYVLSYRLPI